MRINLKKYLPLEIIILLFLISSCGVTSTPRATGNGGSLLLVVKNSKSFNPNIDHGRIVNYRITVTGSDIDTPIVAEFDGAATWGQVDGIPVGEGREVIVEAINTNGLTIRQGEEANIQIKGGKVNDAEVTLQSVPIFTNIADGNSLDNTRLIFKVFSEPNNSVMVEEITGSSQETLIDASTSVPEINLDISTGLGRMAPALQQPGQRTYRIRNMNTGRSSTITVNLNDGTKRHGAPLFSAGDHGDPYPKRRLSCGTH